MIPELKWDVNTVCTALLLCGVAFFSIIERFYPYNQKLPYFRKGYWIDLIWYTFIQSFFLKILIFDLIIAPTKTALGLSEMGYISHWPIWLLVIFFIITHDFYIYWFHRLQHSNKWFWRTHEAHHSVEHVDWLAGSRSHIVEIIINQTIEFAPIFFLLDNETAAIVVPIKALSDALFGQFIHANLKVNLGKLGYIINGPTMHQWHHAEHIEVYHANFATKFSFFDWIFGTAYAPENKKPEKYGLWYEFPRGWFMQHVFSVYRFNVKKVENIPWIKSFLDVRVNIINACIPFLKKHGGKMWKSQKPLDISPVYKEKKELAEMNK